MSILGSDPIIDSDVMEQALIQENIQHFHEGKRPFIGFFDDNGVKSVANHTNSIMFRRGMIRLTGEFLFLQEKRCGILGHIDWSKYGIRHIVAQRVLILEDAHGDLPQSIKAKILYLNDNLSKVEHKTFDCEQVVFSKYWVGDAPGLYDVQVNCMTLSFNDCPKVFHNLTGSCDSIILHCMDFMDVPGLNDSIIQQNVNGKRIKTIKDVRAYYNNPAKYPEFPACDLFDAGKFIKSIGFGKLKALNRVVVKDSGIRFDFVKPTDEWICSNISQL